MRLAVVDIGSNSTRLFLCERIAEAGPHGDRHTQITGLRRGAAPDGTVTAEAIERLEATLRDYARLIRAFGPARTLAIGTSAVRDAPNMETIAAAVEGALGASLTVVSGETEADLAYIGARLAAPDGPAAVIDIGGGSTEVTWIALKPAPNGPAEGGPAEGGAALDGLEILASVSLPLGVVTFAERFGGRRVKPETYRAMVAEVRAAFAPFEAAQGLGAAIAADDVQMLGTSGTVTTLAGVHRGLKRYDRRRVDGCRLGFDDVRATVRRIRAMGYEERVGHPCIGAQRADLVVAGCAILEALCTLWPVGELKVADRGLREGILYHLMNGAAVQRWDGRQG